MKHTFTYFSIISGIFIAESAFSQDINPFYNDENNFSVGLQLSGGFPVGGFNTANVNFPCNSTVSAGSVFEMSLGYKVNTNLGVTGVVSEGFYELDPSNSGVFQLINENPGLYQSVDVMKSGQLIAQSAMGGVFYELPLSKSGKLFSRSHIILGIMGCSVPQIQVVGYHPLGTPDANGNSIDSIETWTTPRIYAYALTYQVGTTLCYAANQSFDVFICIDYQGSSLSYLNVPVTYNLTINNENTSTQNSTTASSENHLKEINASISYQAITVGLGCDVRF